MKKVLIILSTLALIACSEAKNTKTPVGTKKHSETGIVYILTCVEGFEFIATQGSYNYWNFSGPLRKCEE